MTLSDKIITAPKELRCICGKCDLNHLLVSDVKQFIKELKEGIHDWNETACGDKGRNNFIDKLAGDKLAGDKLI